MVQLTARERIILAIDTSTKEQAEKLAAIAQQAGARFMKLGLELSSATSWRYCSSLAASHNLDWIADAKLDDIPNTVAETVRNIANTDHPPFGITMHTKSGLAAMRAGQQAAGNILMFGVTELTAIPPEETYRRYDRPRSDLVKILSHEAVEGTLRGIVASPLEVGDIKSDPITADLFAMIPGTRSTGAESHDQGNIATPAEAIRDGADLLVIGRQITQAERPDLAYEALVTEIEEAL